MANKPEVVVATLKSMPGYVEHFRASFPGEKDPVTFKNMAKAIEAFEATLITPASRFDQYLEGNENILTKEEKAGLALFLDKGCSGCHNGVNLGGNDYSTFGAVERPGAKVLPPEDTGREKVTKKKDDEYVFRTAPLRDIALTAPYFHSGRVWSLEQAVEIMGKAQLGENLSDKDAAKIAAFLGTLTGEQPRIEYPILPVETADTPKPQP